jgi:riboflavin kinase/FMN adenylyltransferase
VKLPASVDDFAALEALERPLHLAIGVFDGVHLGHKAVIESAVFSAQRCGGLSAVLTFDPHPSRLFRPESPTQLILPIETKASLLQAIGVDVMIRKRFDRSYAAIPAGDFLASLKRALPSLVAIYVGSNFRFGQKRAGDVHTLVETGQELGLEVFSVDRIQYNGQPISSTRIREELAQGSIASANALLGYNYATRGSVIAGAKLGRIIGFPTLNVPWEPECQPRFGVYFVRFRSVNEASWQPAVANYGVRPTVSEAQRPLLEVHALETTALTVGATIEVEWLHFIRPEQAFDSIDALRAQIAEDCAKAQTLAKHG